MKLEFEIKDIDRDEVIAAMAQHLLTRYSNEDGDVETRFGAAMRRHLEAKITATAEALVRERIGAVVAQRIEAAVDAVLAEGWTRTDSYGCSTGQKLDLKGRISEILNTKQGDSYNRRGTLIEEAIKLRLEAALAKDFAEELKAAREAFREKLDTTVMAKFTETLKSALGLR